MTENHTRISAPHAFCIVSKALERSRLSEQKISSITKELGALSYFLQCSDKEAAFFTVIQTIASGASSGSASAQQIADYLDIQKVSMYQYKKVFVSLIRFFCLPVLRVFKQIACNQPYVRIGARKNFYNRRPPADFPVQPFKCIRA